MPGALRGTAGTNRTEPNRIGTVGDRGSWVERARTAEPHDRASLFGLVTARTAAGQSAGAEALRATLQRHDPLGEARLDVKRRGLQDPGTAVQLAEACTALGRHGEARAWLKEALALDPRHRPARVTLYHAEQERPHARTTPDLAGTPLTAPGP